MKRWVVTDTCITINTNVNTTFNSNLYDITSTTITTSNTSNNNNNKDNTNNNDAWLPIVELNRKGHNLLCVFYSILFKYDIKYSTI